MACVIWFLGFCVLSIWSGMRGRILHLHPQRSSGEGGYRLSMRPKLNLVVHIFGLLPVDYGLRWSIAASCFVLHGFPDRVPAH